MRVIFLLTILFILPNSLNAQREGRQQRQQQSPQIVTVHGFVVDDNDKTPLAGAHVSFTHFRDTTGTYHTTTDNKGEFILKLPRGRYIMQTSFVGYQTIILDGEKAVRASSDQNNLGTFLMKEGAHLDEVEITGQRSSVRLRGDTLDFDARAFKVNPDATTEDLIRRMPGISVEGERVTAQGEDVRKVLVDGREFFGDDPSIALRNLPAEIVDRIEVYDRLSDQAELTGFDDGERNKTINIVTRLDRRSGQFGRMYSGYGGDERYQLGLATNIFMDNRRISVIGMSNNINEQNFSREDIISLSAGAIRGGQGEGRGGGMGRAAQETGITGASMGHVSDFRVAARNGDNTTHALGLNYSDSWLNDNLKMTGSYFFNFSDNFTDQFTDRQYYLGETENQYYLEDSESSSSNNNHRMNMRMTWDINEQNSLIFVPRITVQNSKADSYLSARNLLEENNILSMSEISHDSNLSGYNYGSSIIYRHRFEKTGRTISTNLSANFNNNQNLYYLDALNDYFAGDGDTGYGEDALIDYLNQESESGTLNNTLSTNLTYTEPFGKNVLMQASYNISRAANETDKLTNSLNTETGLYDEFEAELSDMLKSDYLTHRGALGYRLRGEKYNLTVELGYQHALLSAKQEYPYSSEYFQRNFQNILPRAMLILNIEQGKNLRFSYRTRTNPPSVTQLQEVVDNSNPMLLTSGNSDLDHSYNHFFMSRYNSTNTEKSTSFMAFLFGNLSRDYIGNSTLIARRDTILANGYLLKKGTQFSQPVNLNGFATIRSHITYGFPLRFIKSNLNLTGGLAWMRSPGLINDLSNITNTFTPSGGLVLSSNIGPNVDFSVLYNATYNIVENSIQKYLENNYYSQTSGTRFSFIFLKNWVFRSDVSHLMYRGLGEDFNQDYVLWNMNFGRKLFRNNLGEITLSVFDLLNQNDNIIRNISGSYVEDLRTNQLTRFFMLSFTYNLRNFNISQP